MPRLHRSDREGAFHHVMNRGAGHREVFATERHCIVFLELLQAACSEHVLRLHGYCLMGNHFHLLLESGAGRLSEAMRDVTGRFTRIINGWQASDGPIFRGRFKSVEVVSDRHFLLVSRYVHLNPVAAGLCRRPEEWRWSSARAFRNGRSDWAALVIDDTLALFPAASAVGDYAEFLAAGIDQPTSDFYQRQRLPPTFHTGRRTD